MLGIVSIILFIFIPKTEGNTILYSEDLIILSLTTFAMKLKRKLKRFLITF